MEEDIKIVEHIKNGIKADTKAPNKRLSDIATRKMEALDHLIKACKELEEENKKWNKYCTEDLEKQITELNNKIFELENNSVPKSKIKEIRDKAEVMDYYTLPDVIDDLNKLLEGK